jgi:hypothetical protein
MPDEEDAILDTLKEELEGSVLMLEDETEEDGVRLVLAVPGEVEGEPTLLAAGAIIRGKFVGKRVRVTIEELKS